MDEKEKVFDKNYAKYGGIYLGSATEIEKNIVEELESIRKKVNEYYKDKKAVFITPNGVETKVIKNVNVDAGKYHPYINVFAAGSDEVNAFAGKINDDYYIGILKGVFLELRNHIKAYVEDDAFEEVLEIGKCFPEAILRNLLNVCMDFLIFHEFFHIMNGHCDYVKELGIYELCEINTECAEQGMILQTLEFDADCCAIASIINEFFRSQIMIMQSIPGYGGKYSINSVIQFVSTVLIATYMLNEWLNKVHYTAEITEEKLEKMTHPLPGIRIWYMWFNIGTVITKWNIYNDEEINEILEKSVGSLASFMKAFEDIAYPGFLKIASQELCIKHLQKINDNWETVRELLTGHYCELAPYEKVDVGVFFGR